jgi:LysR family transcriptional regulator, glycine cleavage system transcriptional activator
MSRLPSLFALRALEAAARHGSYSAAARELAVTQGAVSQQIRSLETRFGTRAFTRRGNRMVPTPVAARFAEEVREALNRLSIALEVVERGASDQSLVLSIENRFGSRWLGPKLPRLLADAAGFNLEIHVEERVANFLTDGIDAVVRFGRGDWPGLESQRLTTDRLWVVCSPEYAVRHAISEPGDLLHAPLIHNSENLWPLLFDRHALPSPPAHGLVANDTLVTLDAVARGVGAALVRSSMVEEDVRCGKLTRPVNDSIPLPLNFIRAGQCVRFVRSEEPAPPELGYFLAWPHESRKRERIETLRNWLIEAAAESRIDE